MAETVIESRADAAASVETAIAHIYQAAKARMKELAGRFHPDLQPVAYGLLRLVFEREPVRSSDLAQIMGMDKGAVSRQVTALREMGLIETQHDPADGRAALLVSSASARRALAAFHSESSSDFARIFAEWPTDEMIELGRLLGKFNDAIR
ncbi:MarR family transcriptional regulator [soil metagenome]